MCKFKKKRLKRNKQRHGCLTAWLIYLIIAYSIGSLGLFFGSENIYKQMPLILRKTPKIIELNKIDKIDFRKTMGLIK